MDEAQRQRDAHLELSRTVPGPGLPLRFLQTRPAPIPPSAWQRFYMALVPGCVRMRLCASAVTWGRVGAAGEGEVGKKGGRGHRTAQQHLRSIWRR